MAHDDNPADYGYGARAVIDSIERLFGRLHRNRRYVPAAQPVKVNLGSGLRIAPGWINVDGSLKTLLAGRSSFTAGLAYKFLTDSKSMPRDRFIDLLSNNVFVHHNLKLAACEEPTGANR